MRPSTADSGGRRGMGAPRDPPGERAGRDWGWVPYPEGHRKRASFIKNYESMLATREACREHVYSPDVRAVLDSEAFRLAKSRRTLAYDPDAHPVLARFRAATRDPGGDPTADLSTLHHRFETPHDRARSHLEDKSRFLGPLARPSRARDAFADAYDALVREVILPAVVQPIPGEDRALYAAFPCVRVQQPCDFHTIRVHVDSMYNHPEGSINCWLPLTRTFGANSLHIESSPGAEDFEPLDMRPGQIAVFDGTACAHYTLANTTERTRVSLDFRVVPGSARDPDAEASSTTLPGGGRRQIYNVGGYYSEARLIDGAWIRTVAGTPCVRHGFPHVNPEPETDRLEQPPSDNRSRRAV